MASSNKWFDTLQGGGDKKVTFQENSEDPGLYNVYFL